MGIRSSAVAQVLRCAVFLLVLRTPPMLRCWLSLLTGLVEEQDEEEEETVGRIPTPRAVAFCSGATGAQTGPLGPARVGT